MVDVVRGVLEIFGDGLSGVGYEGSAVVKGHSILDTENGGLHWSKIADISVDVHDIDFISLKCGWLATSDGLLNTQDGGITWKEISKPLIKATNQVQFVDEKNGWVIVGNGASLGPLMGTTDGGNNWTSYEVPGLSLWPSVAFSFISQEHTCVFYVTT